MDVFGTSIIILLKMGRSSRWDVVWFLLLVLGACGDALLMYLKNTDFILLNDGLRKICLMNVNFRKWKLFLNTVKVKMKAFYSRYGELSHIVSESILCTIFP